MKICMSGASGVGKKTLLKSVNQVLQLPVIPSPTREIMSDMGIKSVVDMCLRGLEFPFQDRVVNKVISTHSEAKDLISDRSFFDHMGYDRARFISSRDYLKMMERTKLKYDLIVCVPIEFPILNDGVRDMNVSDIFKIEEEIFASIRDSKTPFMIVHGTVEDRTHAVLGALMALYDGMKTRIINNQKNVTRLVA